MKKIFLIIITAISIITNYTAYADEVITEEWSETTAVITTQGKTDDKFNYTIVYDIPNSSAIDLNDKKIVGPVIQKLSSTQEPINNQKLRLKYLKSNPNIYELIEPIQFN